MYFISEVFVDIPSSGRFSADAPCKRAFTDYLSDSPHVHHLPAMLRISSVDDSVGWISFFIVRGGSI